MHRMLEIEGADLNTGKIIRFNENTDEDTIVKAIIGSASIPLFFPLV